jgi:superfamily II DNA or RNA helicase
MIELREYQTQCLNELNLHFCFNNNGLISIPTGGGKTIIFNQFAYENFNRVIVVSHTEELIEQAIEKAKYIYNENEVGKYAANVSDIKDKRLVSASIQTLYSRINTDKLNELISINFELMVCDESQHAPAESYTKVFNYFKQFNPELKLLGVTATPFRTDKKSLQKYFDTLVYKVDIQELIQLGYLVPIDGYKINLPVDLKLLKLSDGDYTKESISNAFNKEDVNNEIINKWFEYSANRKTIFFFSSIEHSKAITNLLINKGIVAAHIDGAMDMQLRKQIINDFHSNKIQVLCNMNILCEGFDEPAVETIAMVRPTKSLGLYCQQIGRGLRPSYTTNKSNCLILDYTGNSDDHKLIHLGDLFEGCTNKKAKQLHIKLIVGTETIIRTKKEIEFNYGDQDVHFNLFNNVIYGYITKHKEFKILMCGVKAGYIIAKNYSNFSKVIVINDNKKIVKIVDNLSNNLVDETIIELWNKYKADNFSESNLLAMANETASEKQTTLIYKNKKFFKKDRGKMNKLEACHLITYIFYKYTFEKPKENWYNKRR